MVASRQVEIPFFRGIGKNRGPGFGALSKLLGEPQFPFCVNLSSQRQNAWVLICCNSLCRKKQMLLKVEKTSRQLQRVWEDELGENN